jgi:hypothetical protein
MLLPLMLRKRGTTGDGREHQHSHNPRTQSAHRQTPFL